MGFSRRLTLAAAVLAFLSGLVAHAPDLLVRGLFSEGADVGTTIGRLVTSAFFGFNVVNFLLVPVGAAALGYLATRRLTLVDQYRELVVSVALGWLVGYVVGVSVFGLFVLELTLSTRFLGGLYVAVTRLPTFVVAVFAGAAFSEIRTVERSRTTNDSELS
jgi:hypothetical protein